MNKITDIYRILYSGWYSLALFLFVPAFLYLLYLIFAVALHNDQRLTLISFWGLFGLLGDYMVFNDLFIKNGKESVPVSGLLHSSYYGRCPAKICAAGCTDGHCGCPWEMVLCRQSYRDDGS